MQKADFTLKNESGLHARPATLFEEKAQSFRSEIMIEKDGEIFDGKSIIDILCAAAAMGETITITADGDDEDAALASMLALMESFDE